MLTACSHNKILICFRCRPPNFPNLPFLSQVRLERHVPKSSWLERERNSNRAREGDGRVKLTPCLVLAAAYAPPRYELASRVGVR